ncbi:hypothetical protein K6V98_07995 [Collinsella sp. AGMB00827]|uniref:Uncharacterized protein n=1 Tax=Collinsella ureilytica TaxID=2869515 RepID=A0ABS7MLP5_9ACTN|nr:hypothetical protein [Collinsella urealyticum]MBY4798285.1 hypothetical protein [Collinsella urealyticum]
MNYSEYADEVMSDAEVYIEQALDHDVNRSWDEAREEILDSVSGNSIILIQFLILKNTFLMQTFCRGKRKTSLRCVTQKYLVKALLQQQRLQAATA